MLKKNPLTVKLRNISTDQSNYAVPCMWLNQRAFLITFFVYAYVLPFLLFSYYFPFIFVRFMYFYAHFFSYFSFFFILFLFPLSPFVSFVSPFSFVVSRPFLFHPLFPFTSFRSLRRYGNIFYLNIRKLLTFWLYFSFYLHNT